MSDTVTGVLQETPRGGGHLRNLTRSFRPSPDDPVVPPGLIRQFGLAAGAAVSGPVRRGQRGGRELAGVDTVCGMKPAEFAERKRLSELAAIDPCERFDLGASGDIAMRLVDLIAPIGKGTRGLIVSPPKAGKTMLLEKIAKSIRASEPETRIIVLLIDERPEEVTAFRRAVDAEVFASSNDQSVKEHVDLAELTLAHMQVELECGRHVVALVDSLTRMGRAFNLKGGGNRGRTMSGGLEAGALQIPRRFFGLARNIERGGSVTIIATALVDTESRMDQMIFEEFKGTGNSELILSRDLADARVFPAIDIAASGTRKEERLYPPEPARRIALIRRALAGKKPRDMLEALKTQLEKHPNNAAFLESLPVR